MPPAQEARSDDDSARRSDPAGSGRSRWATFLAFAALGAILTLALYVVWNRMRGPLRPITAADLAEARQRWAENGVDDYLVEIAVQGPQPAEYRVEVRRGEVIQAIRNGHPLKQRRTWDTWSVPGMLDTVATDLERQQQTDSDPPVQVRVLGYFDPRLGLPRRYLRIDDYPRGQRLEVSWEVTRFEPRDANALPSPATDSAPDPGVTTAPDASSTPQEPT